MAGCFGCSGCFSGLRGRSRKDSAGKQAHFRDTFAEHTCPEEPCCKAALVEVQPEEAEAILLEVEERERQRLADEAKALWHRESEEMLKSAMDAEDEALRDMQEATQLCEKKDQAEAEDKVAVVATAEPVVLQWNNSAEFNAAENLKTARPVATSVVMLAPTAVWHPRTSMTSMATTATTVILETESEVELEPSPRGARSFCACMGCWQCRASE